MSMDPLVFLSRLPERFAAGVQYRTETGKVKKEYGMAVKTDPPEIEVRLGPGAEPDAHPGSGSDAPPNAVDCTGDCMVFIEGDGIVTLTCTIRDAAGPGVLVLEVREAARHYEKRKYFRRPADRLDIRWRRKHGRPCFTARGINISSGGLLVMLTGEQVAEKDTLVFEIDFPEPVEKTLSAEATVVRFEKIAENDYRVAVMLENADEIADDIMQFCFAEQRRMLREKVMTKGVRREVRDF